MRTAGDQDQARGAFDDQRLLPDGGSELPRGVGAVGDPAWLLDLPDLAVGAADLFLEVSGRIAGHTP